MSSLRYNSSPKQFTDPKLLNRGHSVTGISRNPNSIGTHKNYKGISLNVFDAPTDEFAAAIKGHDVVIWLPISNCEYWRPVLLVLTLDMLLRMSRSLKGCARLSLLSRQLLCLISLWLVALGRLFWRVKGSIAVIPRTFGLRYADYKMIWDSSTSIWLRGRQFMLLIWKQSCLQKELRYESRCTH